MLSFPAQKMKVVTFFISFSPDRNEYVNMYPNSSVFICMFQCAIINYICIYNNDIASQHETAFAVYFSYV